MMESEETIPVPPEEDYLENLRYQIKKSPEAIDRECSRTDNDWLACYASRVQVINSALGAAKDEGHINETAYQNAHEKLQTMKKRLEELRVQYQQKEQEVPESMRPELLKMLNILE